VCVTGETLQFAAGYVDVKPLGPVAVKGLATAVAVGELLGVVPIRTRLQALAACGLTRFVGRQTELATLREALEHTSTGRDQVMAVIGESGVGQTVSSASLPAPIIATGGWSSKAVQSPMAGRLPTSRFGTSSSATSRSRTATQCDGCGRK
jgi:hypothetical protein